VSPSLAAFQMSDCSKPTFIPAKPGHCG